MTNTVQTIDKRIDTLVHKRVIEVMREILSDLDYGSELSPDFVKRLQNSVQFKKSGRTIGLDKVLKKYNPEAI